MIVLVDGCRVSFSKTVQMRRHKESLNIRQCSERLGISKATLSRIENGKGVSVGTFIKVCEWLNVDPKVFFVNGGINQFMR